MSLMTDDRRPSLRAVAAVAPDDPSDLDPASSEASPEPTDPLPDDAADETGASAGSPERDAIIRRLHDDARLRGRLVRMIRKQGVKNENDVDEVLQETLFAAARAPHLPGEETPGRLHAFVAGIARNKAVDWLHKRDETPEDAHGLDLAEVAGADAGEEPYQRELLRSVARHVPVGQRDVWSCMMRVATGEKLAEIAEELGVPYEALHKRVSRLRAQLASVVAAMVALVVFGEARRVPAMAPDVIEDVPSLAHAVDTHVEHADPVDAAAALRGRAFAECMAYSWARCLDDLDLAREIDPAGDSDPRVTAARDDVRASFDHDTSKPGAAPWTPKGRAVYGSSVSR